MGKTVILENDIAEQFDFCCSLTKMTDEEIASEMRVSRGSLPRWREGNGCRIQKPNLLAIKKFIEKYSRKSKGFNNKCEFGDDECPFSKPEFKYIKILVEEMRKMSTAQQLSLLEAMESIISKKKADEQLDPQAEGDIAV